MAGVTPGRVATIGDAFALGVALWFIAGAAFAEVPAKPLLDAVAAVVILLSLRRLWQRYRGRA